MHIKLKILVIIGLFFLKTEAQIKNEKSLKEIEKKFDSNLSAKRIGETIKNYLHFHTT